MDKAHLVHVYKSSAQSEDPQKPYKSLLSQWIWSFYNLIPKNYY